MHIGVTGREKRPILRNSRPRTSDVTLITYRLVGLKKKFQRNPSG